MRGNIDNRIDRIRHEIPAGCASDGRGQSIIRLPMHSSEVTIILTDITLPLPPERLALLTAADLEYADRFTNAGRRVANLTWRAALRSAIREGIVPLPFPQAVPSPSEPVVSDTQGSSAPAQLSQTAPSPGAPSPCTPSPCNGSSPYRPEAYADANIEYSPCGAPFIAGNPFRFGVSHTSDKAALIIADTPCAIDIERADRDFSRVAARILTDRERQLAAECPVPNATGLMWCAKETIYKLSGSGSDFGSSDDGGDNGDNGYGSNIAMERINSDNGGIGSSIANIGDSRDNGSKSIAFRRDSAIDRIDDNSDSDTDDNGGVNSGCSRNDNDNGKGSDNDSKGIDFSRDIAIERIDPVTRTIDGRLSVGGRQRMIRLHYRSSAEHLVVLAADNI